MKSKTQSILKSILIELKEVNNYDYKENQIYDDWDGSLSFNGVKRLIYGLWHNGENELGHNLLKHMSKTAKKKYKTMIKKYSQCEEIILTIKD